jgi:adenylate cyclase
MYDPDSDLARLSLVLTPSTNQDPRDITAIRQDLRTILDQILGCCEMVFDKKHSADCASLGPALQEIRAVAECVRGVMDASASAHANNRSLRNFGDRLRQLSGHILSCATDVVKLKGRSPEGELETDLKQIEVSSRGLVTLAEELIRYHSFHAATTARWSAVSPMLLGESRTSIATPIGHGPERGGMVLIADDNEGNRRLVARRLEREGYSTLMAADGFEALKILRVHKVDLVLLDVMMPELDGLGTLQRLKEDPDLRDIPVIMVSAVEEISSVTACIEHGADDYLPKPIDTAILKARVRSLVERVRLRRLDQERTSELRQALIDIERERQISDNLLLNILPNAVAEELRTKNSVEPRYYEDATIVFTDFAGFTPSTANISAEELVMTLHAYFTGFDNIIDQYGLEKLKTIGDSYLYVGGLPSRSSSHPVDAILAAWQIIQFGMHRAKSGDSIHWPVRIGVHTGPVIAGVVGIHKFAFDIWGESVNFASRMESSGAPNQINISDRTYVRVKDFFACEPRGRLRTKDGQEVEMYFVKSLAPPLMVDQAAFARRYRAYFRKDPPEVPAGLLTSGGIA